MDLSVSVFNDFSTRDLLLEPISRLNETCTDLDLGEICTTNCADATSNCLSNCFSGDASCENICIREGFACIDGCPCHIDCPGGCEGCSNDICNACLEPESNEDHVTCLEDYEKVLFDCFQDCAGNTLCIDQCTLEFSENIENCPCERGCPNGCPCPNYECGGNDSDQLGAVLVMRRHRVPALPLLVNFKSFTTDLEVSWFNNGPDNLVFDSKKGCSILYKGTHYLFGGFTTDEYGNFLEYGPHILDGCDIVNAEGVSFMFDCYYGAVGYLPTEDEKEAYIMLYHVHDYWYSNRVEGYDGSKILTTEIPRSNNTHGFTGGQIPTYKGNPILISGAGYESTSSVERFSLTNGWTEYEDLVFPDEYIEAYTSVWGDFGVVVFPGNSGSNQKIWRLYDDKWTNIGKLPTADFEVTRRFPKAVLFPNNEVMMIGGHQNHKFVKYTFNDDFTSIEGDILQDLPLLVEYDGPYAIFVENNYCSV